MRLILTRHGQTVDNVNNTVQGQNPGKLSELGISQAKKLAERLKREDISVIFSSDLKRASDTAKIVSYSLAIPIYFDPNLKERNYASLAGKKWSEVDWKNLPDDVETLASMEKRVKNFILKAEKNYSGKTILVVGHGGIDKMIALVIQGRKIEDYPAIEKVGNATISIFNKTDSFNYEIELYNSTEHLK